LRSVHVARVVAILLWKRNAYESRIVELLATVSSSSAPSDVAGFTAYAAVSESDIFGFFSLLRHTEDLIFKLRHVRKAPIANPIGRRKSFGAFVLAISFPNPKTLVEEEILAQHSCASAH
jgi:hypothetical protein